MKLLIRLATVADIAAMMALETHAATAAHWSLAQYGAVFENEIPRRLALVAEVLEEVLEKGGEQKDREGGKDRSAVQGFLVARSLGDEWELENIAVSGSARRRGLGSRLLGEFLGHARAGRASAIFLEVRESNTAARLLYEKWDFAQTGRRTDYYKDPDEDAVLYRLDFA